ncbi:tripartite motif-containing protein 16-like [Conger conger]|uniref:tripartite motif-containing protein 16-like n=1 Tax=Conger conger TaxID=82655 RepID=UPI002A5A3419|nr:tripartite motif-containing protein 16-like [Conger conger]
MEEVWNALKLLTMDESVKEIHIVELRTREDFLKYYCHLTLDPNTASNCLSLPEGNREANRMRELQSYPDCPERFAKMAAVLCEQGLSGCHYWEVDWSGKGRVNIAVAYEDIDRKAGALGHDDKSWRLRCSDTSCGFWHNNEETELPDSPSSRIGVYLDHKAGILSFYSVAGTMTRLHRIETKFTQPLYPGFWLDENCSVKLVDLESEPEKKALQPDKKEK